MKRNEENSQGKTTKKRKLHDEGDEDLQFGTIESIVLHNFMCHDNLKFDFGPRLNFIIGQNGSGKSAILTGIILALGGTSNNTGRFSNIKGFVKTGKHKAHMAVTLRNCGSFAYKSDIYGPRIIVERDISIDGLSSYKIKSSEGHTVSTGKEELNSILAAMDIKIANPVVILTQETSRNFLCSKHARAERLYTFYKEGCGLQKVENDYNETAQTKEETEKGYLAKRQVLPELEKDIKRWKKILDSSSKINNYRNELLWANVIEIEKRREQKKAEFVKKQKEISIIKSQIVNCKDAFDKQVLDLAEFQKQKAECDEAMIQNRRVLADLRVEKEKFAEIKRKKEGSISLSRREIQRINEEILSLQNSQREHLQKNQSDVNAETAKREGRISQLVNENQALVSRLKQLEQQYKSISDEQYETRELINSVGTEISSFQYTIQNLEGDIRNMQNARKDKMLVFGEHTLNVLRDIKQCEQKNQFIKTPKGPIGMFCSVKDPRWSPAIEFSVNASLLKSFCCDNTQDSEKLNSILKKYYNRQVPSIIISKFLTTVHEVHRINCPFPTVLDMLEIRDPVIANCLIDQASIETKVLIEDLNDAMNLMMDNPPQHCSAAYLKNCDMFLCRPYRSYSYGGHAKRSILETVRQDDINEKNMQIQKSNEQLSLKRNFLLELKAKLCSYQNQFETVDKEVIHVKMEIKKRDEEIKEQQSIEDPKDAYCLQDDLDLLYAEKVKKEAEKVQLTEEFRILNEQTLQFKQRWDEERASLQTEQAKFNELGDKINKCGKDKETLSTGKFRYEKDLQSQENTLISLQNEVGEYDECYDSAKKDASEVCKRIDTDRSPDLLRRLLEETEKVVEQQINCSREEMIDRYKEKCKEYSDTKKKMDHMEKLIIKTDEMVKVRISNLALLIKHSQYQLDMQFQAYLSGNNYKGNLKFDDKLQRLVMDVSPRQTDQNHKSCITLSGGERSYVQISFLVALWSMMKMPFTILDEYDVFMDLKNRKLSMELLIRKSKDLIGMQFIFLSPLDLPNIKQTDNMKIHQMPAPQRVGLTQK